MDLEEPNHLGSHAAHQDMVDYIESLTEPYRTFAQERKLQRAAEWLADNGYVSTLPPPAPLTTPKPEPSAPGGLPK